MRHISARPIWLIALLALALPVALAACGDSGTTTVTETTGTATGTTDTTGSTATTSTNSGTGPSGELTSSGVGEVKRGATTDQAQALFGEPAKTQKGPGCELSPDSQGALAWTYNLEGGQLILDFDAASGELGSYRNTSPTFETTLGDKVGDPFTSLQENWGDSLQPLVLGSAKPSTKAGFWQVKDGDNALLFDIRGGEIAAISGGHIEICE